MARARETSCGLFLKSLLFAPQRESEVRDLSGEQEVDLGCSALGGLKDAPTHVGDSLSSFPCPKAIPLSEHGFWREPLGCGSARAAGAGWFSEALKERLLI